MGSGSAASFAMGFNTDEPGNAEFGVPRVPFYLGVAWLWSWRPLAFGTGFCGAIGAE